MEIIRVDGDHLQVGLVDHVVVVVVREPEALRAVRPLGVLVRVELQAAVGLALGHGSSARLAVGTAGKGVAVPEVMVAEDAEPRHLVERAIGVVRAVGRLPRDLPGVRLDARPVEVVPGGGDEEQLLARSGPLPDVGLHLVRNCQLADPRAARLAPVAEDEEVVVLARGGGLDPQRVLAIVVVHVDVAESVMGGVARAGGS
mmetsp:Transcript_40572/g.121276  ORF Transcript_40572/g.121276 Transcript_40572/m.121276 type:complete len:201 (+) Transcript_40572:537-1139(+)